MSRFSFRGPCMAWGYSLPPVCNNMIPSNTRFRTSTALMPRSGKQRDISSITYVRGDSRAAELAPVLGSYWKSLNSQTSPCASLGTRSRALIIPGGMGFPFWGSGAMSEKSASILAKLPPICVQTTVTRALVSMWLEPSAELV